MIQVCGYNNWFQLAEKSNTVNTYGDPSISPPLTLPLDPSTILSYSVYQTCTVIIKKNGIAIGLGNSYRISPSLPHQKLEHYTEFIIKDSQCRTLTPLSVVCGEDYTLYIVSNPEDSSKSQLAYTYSDMKDDYPVILDIYGLNPIALFGGRHHSASICEDDGIIFIHNTCLKSKSSIPVMYLPGDEKPIFVACLDRFVFVLSSSGQLFKSSSSLDNIDFVEVEELKNIKIVDISGTCDTCFALSCDGRVFGFGSNDEGILGLSKGVNELKKFSEITSLRKHRIVSVYAGERHTLFQAVDGKILSCGYNDCGPLILDRELSREPVYGPTETLITSGASFCISGNHVSVIFSGFVPPNMPNKVIRNKGIIFSSQNSMQQEIISLKEENSRLKKENEMLLMKNKKGDHKKVAENLFQILDISTIDNFHRVSQIGQGAQSRVFKVTRNEYFVIKELIIKNNLEEEEEECDKNSNDSFIGMKRLLQEIEILNRLNHPNIIKAFGICFGDEIHPPSILEEFCPNNLNDMVKKLTDFNRVTIIYELSLAMREVHLSNIIHRDLKPENILLDENGHVKICDFGVSCISNSTQSKTSGIGTLKFMAPEILNESTDYDEKVDVYSFGVVVYFILTKGQLPKTSIADVLLGKKAPIPTKINEFSKSLINNCWSLSSSDRPSFAEIVEMIESNQFKLIDGIENNISQIKEFLTCQISSINS